MRVEYLYSEVMEVDLSLLTEEISTNHNLIFNLLIGWFKLYILNR